MDLVETCRPVGVTSMAGFIIRAGPDPRRPGAQGSAALSALGLGARSRHQGLLRQHRLGADAQGCPPTYSAPAEWRPRLPPAARETASHVIAASRECFARLIATISATIETAISSGVIAPRSRPAGAFSFSRRSTLAPFSKSTGFRAAAFLRLPTNAT